MRVAILVLSLIALASAKPYDWTKWVSKKGGKSSVSAVSSSDVSSSGEGKFGKGGFDWKKFLSSNSFIPSGIFDYAPERQDAFDWRKFVSSNSFIPSGIFDYDSEKQEAFDWRSFVPSEFDSFIPSEFGNQQDAGPYDWRKWLSTSYVPSEVLDSYIPSDIIYAPKKGKVSKTSKGGKYDWKKWLSKRTSVSGSDSTSGSSVLVSSQDTSKSGKVKGGYDWKKWLSKRGSVSGSDVASTSDLSVSTSSVNNKKSGKGKGGYDWKKWLSKSNVVSESPIDVSGSGSNDQGSDSGVKSSGKGGYDWKKWLSNSFDNSILSSMQEKYSFSPFDWKSYLP